VRAFLVAAVLFATVQANALECGKYLAAHVCSPYFPAAARGWGCKADARPVSLAIRSGGGTGHSRPGTLPC